MTEYSCPRCKVAMVETLGLLLPTYRTYICEKCGSLFYDLEDQKQLEAIMASVTLRVLGLSEDKQQKRLPHHR